MSVRESMSDKDRIRLLEQRIDMLIEAIYKEADNQAEEAKHFKSFWSSSAETSALTVAKSLYRIRVRALGEVPIC